MFSNSFVDTSDVSISFNNSPFLIIPMRLQVSRILKISWEAIKIPAPLVANFLKSADNSLLASGSKPLAGSSNNIRWLL